MAAMGAASASAAASQETDPASPADASEDAEPPKTPADRFHASAYLPLDHWAYPIVSHWIAAGRISSLSPVVQPYRRMDVARAVHRLEQDADLSRSDRDWIDRLRTELAPEMRLLDGGAEDADDLTLFGTLGGTYRSQTHRDVLRPELEGEFAADRLLERLFFESYGSLAVVAGAFRAGRDGIYLHDAQYPDGRVVPEKRAPIADELGVRVEEAWVELQTKYASVFFGRMYRNWGLPSMLGLMRSDHAYSQEEVAYRFGTDRIFLTGSVAPFADFGADTTHYFSTHRLEVRPTDNFMFAVGEAVVHGGPGQPLVFSYINPIGLWILAEGDDDPPRNVVGQLDLWWRPAGGVTLFGSLLADATNSPESSNSCCQMGGSLGFELARLVPGWSFRATGTALQSLVHRASNPWEVYAVESIGLGWDKVDLYLATLSADWFGPAGLFLQPRLDLLWKGEGDFREQMPSQDELPSFPRILVGVTETTVRPGIAGRWRPPIGPSWLDLEWDIGLNFIGSAAHVAGESRTEFVGNLRVVWETPRAIIPLR